MIDVTSTGPFAREPVDRGYRLIALGYAVEFAAMIAEEHDGRRVDGFMAIRHLGRAIDEEATALVEALEKAERDTRGR